MLVQRHASEMEQWTMEEALKYKTSLPNKIMYHLMEKTLNSFAIHSIRRLIHIIVFLREFLEN